jgi:hypothetical protein
MACLGMMVRLWVSLNYGRPMDLNDYIPCAAYEIACLRNVSGARACGIRTVDYVEK